MNWIDIKDKLPPLSDFRPPAQGEPMPQKIGVLVSTDKGRVFETTYTGLGFANLYGQTALAWMPLPEPYTNKN